MTDRCHYEGVCDRSGLMPDLPKLFVLKVVGLPQSLVPRSFADSCYKCCLEQVGLCSKVYWVQDSTRNEGRSGLMRLVPFIFVLFLIGTLLKAMGQRRRSSSLSRAIHVVLWREKSAPKFPPSIDYRTGCYRLPHRPYPADPPNKPE